MQETKLKEIKHCNQTYYYQLLEFGDTEIAVFAITPKCTYAKVYKLEIWSLANAFADFLQNIK